MREEITEPFPGERRGLGLWLSDDPVSVRVAGTSMEPFLREGDRVEVVRAAPGRFNPGDLAVFSREGELVIHRFLLARGETFLEKGDAQTMGNWHRWPTDLGVARAVLKGEERQDLLAPPWPREMRAAAARHLRIHRLHAAAQRLPGSLTRRVFLRLARPLLRT